MWTTCDKLNFYENGLVKNVNYYRPLSNKRGYFITADKSLSFSIKELLADDFLTLNTKEWLSSFVIDHCFHILNKRSGNKFQIISVEKSSFILMEPVNEQSLNDINHVIQSIELDKKCIAMPIHKNNHFYLLILFLHEHENEIIILDPMGNQKYAELLFLPKVLHFLKIKNLPYNNLTVKKLKHLTQVDGYNCGVYTIYFFSKICENGALDDWVDINNYRTDLKTLLLTNSDPIKLKCLYCFNETKNKEDYFKCRTCLRCIHNHCIQTIAELKMKVNPNSKILNGICELCREYNSSHFT